MVEACSYKRATFVVRLFEFPMLFDHWLARMKPLDQGTTVVHVQLLSPRQIMLEGWQSGRRQAVLYFPVDYILSVDLEKLRGRKEGIFSILGDDVLT